jgi:hypothetical protein
VYKRQGKIQSTAVNDSKSAVNTLQKNASKETTNETVSTEPANINAYKGDWKLKVAEDEKLYLLSSLEDYFGRTALEIKSINNDVVKGTISSIQGAPSYRQASVDFEGEAKDNKLTASYKDENWLYSGKIELSFKPGEVAANITRDKTKETPMWGIPQGKFSFVKPIETKSITLNKKEIGELEGLLAPATQDSIGAFSSGELTDAMIVKFAGINLAAGFIKPSDFGDRVKESGPRWLSTRMWLTRSEKSISEQKSRDRNQAKSLSLKMGLTAFHRLAASQKFRQYRSY